ncbi:phosphatase PAP2 family protein [Streptomyces sp. NPDC017979]|uniref:phosphatase PAP2 family protein n=1 Tax=Streptomyces sp. NPDC017979 TaxID=3365024 RepID=UPI0037BAB44F
MTGTRRGGPDRALLAALRDCGEQPAVGAAARALSLAGEHAALWLATGLAGAATDPARRTAWLRATAVVAGAHLASMAVKRVVRRPRPSAAAPLVHTAGAHSFPSSHATSSAAATIAFAPLLPRAPLPALAAAICVSRLVAGVHYPTDVAAGALLGAVAARLAGGTEGAGSCATSRARPAAEPRAAGQRRAVTTAAPSRVPATPGRPQ